MPKFLYSMLAKQNTGSTPLASSDEMALQSVFALRLAGRWPVQQHVGERMDMLLNICVRPGTLPAT